MFCFMESSIIGFSLESKSFSVYLWGLLSCIFINNILAVFFFFFSESVIFKLSDRQCPLIFKGLV